VFIISFTVDGRPEVPAAQQPSMDVAVATPGYFRAMGIELVRGRAFTPADDERAPQVVLLSETAARRHVAGEEPLGTVIRLGMGRGRGRKAGGEVVGIVRDVKHRGLAKESPPEIYVPYAQFPLQSMAVVMRTDVPPRTLAVGAE
jgi:putative ABC transport system permease protein